MGRVIDLTPTLFCILAETKISNLLKPQLGRHKANKEKSMSQPNIPKPEFLCHYTSVDVLCKLFTEMENGKMSFHASSVDFMNDSATGSQWYRWH